MADYQMLVDDARALAGVSKTDVSDKQFARQLWRKCVQFVTEIAELGGEDARMPRTSATVTIPGDLLTGITLPTVADMVKLIGVILTYADDTQTWVNVIDAGSRTDLVGRTPAAYVLGTAMYPIPGSGISGVWTHAIISAAGWASVSSAAAEYFTYPTEVAAMSDTFPLDAVFQEPAILGVAARYNAVLVEEAQVTKQEMLVSLSRRIETEVEVVKAVVSI